MHVKRREKERRTESAVGFTSENEREGMRKREGERCREEQDMEKAS